MTAATRILESISRAIGNERVFSDPVTHDGITVITASNVTGGGGGGGGEQTSEGPSPDSGDGGGFGVSARPAGAFVITDGRVRWKPSIDVTKIILFGQAVGAMYFVAIWLIERSKSRAAVKIAKYAGATRHG